MADTIQQIKDKLSIADVVSSYVKLTKAGKYHKGLCPFHNEKSPSFMVSPDRDFYHCFGCGKGGDIFSFVQDIEKVDFKEALSMLAEKAGVEVEYTKTENKNEKEVLFSVLKDAEAFFVETLSKNSGAQKYLTGRGLTEETIERFRVGYAPNEWRVLSDHLKEKGYTTKNIEDAGLSKRSEEEKEREPYDRFRGRVMFSIRDAQGRVVGFSGRIFEDDPKHPQAKYVNSPETALFHKSRILYGLDMARQGIRKYNFALLVEGQVDLLMAHQAGFSNAIALSGTGFTEEHAALIKRHSDNLLIVFDGDTAGVAAAGRAAAITLKLGINTKIAAITPGKDPADMIQENPESFKQVVRDALHVVDFYLKYVRDSGYDARTFKLEAARTVLPFLNLIQSAIDREHFTARVANALGVSENAVEEELVKFKSETTAPKERSNSVQAKTVEPFLSRGDTLERLLIGMLLVFEENKNEELHAKVHETLLLGMSQGEIQEYTLHPENSRIAVIEADVYLENYTDPNALGPAIDELIHDFKKEVARRKYREATQKLKQLEAGEGSEESATLLAEIARLAKEL